ncbi:MAG: GntR family transcriptional regulator [Deltaproteobacteria bacterium]|nr:GntR family transcriptional regulator [Deltaproteobacteria bacterium]
MGMKFIPLDRNSYKPIYIQIADIVASQIHSGDLLPGDKLPTEAELCQHYQVSRLTVRQAFLRLEWDGLIQKYQGKGTFVAQPKMQEKLDPLYPMEELIESKNIHMDILFKEFRKVYPPSRVRKNLGLEEREQAYKLKRVRSIAGNVIGMETRFVPLSIGQRFSRQDLREVPFLALLNRYPDTAVHRMAVQIRAGIIADGDAEVMNVSTREPVLIRETILHNAENKPVASGKALFLASRYEIHMDITQASDADKRVVVLDEFKRFKRAAGSRM